jgi:hypothetical protein
MSNDDAVANVTDENASRFGVQANNCDWVQEVAVDCWIFRFVIIVIHIISYV